MYPEKSTDSLVILLEPEQLLSNSFSADAVQCATDCKQQALYHQDLPIQHEGSQNTGSNLDSGTQNGGSVHHMVMQLTMMRCNQLSVLTMLD